MSSVASLVTGIFLLLLPLLVNAGTTVNISCNTSSTPTATGAGVKVDSSSGTSCVPGPVSVTKNDNHTFYLVPPSGYGFLALTYDSSSVTGSVSCPSGIYSTCSYTNAVGNSDHTLAATFLKKYTVTPSITSSCGTSSISPSSAISVLHNGTISIVAAPEAGNCGLNQILFNDTPISGFTPTFTSYSYTSQAITADSSVKFVFGAVTKGAVTITVPVGGQVSDNQGNATVTSANSPKTYSYNNGTTVSYAVTPDSANGYVIKNIAITKNGVTSNYTTSPQIITVSNNDTASVTVQFAQQFTVTPSISGGSGSITPNTAQTVLTGNSLAFTIAPQTGYAIKDIKFNGVSQLSAPQIVASYSYTTPPITANSTVAVELTPIYYITTSVSGNGSFAPSGTIPVISGDSKTFIMTPGNNATVVSDVKVDNVSVGAVNSYTFSNVTANHNILAVFTAAPSLLDQYTITPPFVQAVIKPNMLLMIDNSSSMYDLANTDPATYCYDASYNNTATYAGYFDPTLYYSYNSGAGRFESGATMPGSCTFRTADFCVAMQGAKPSRTVSNFVAKGNFLNWLAVSKLDLQKKILTGGKYDSANNIMVSESRGCLGKRFVKRVAVTLASGSTESINDVTFSVRGPTSTDADYVNPATQAGTSRIEIYDAPFNSGDCNKAVADWQTLTDPAATDANLGATQGDSTACIACTSASCSTTQTLKAEAYLHMVHNCYWYYTGHSFSNTNTLTGDCDNIYQLPAYNNNPAAITNNKGGDAICSSVIAHPYYYSDPIIGSSYNPNDTGYLGKCVSIGTGPGGKNAWDSTCLNTEMADFCRSLGGSDVTDPTVVQNGTTGVITSGSVPSFIMDAGVNSLGSAAATYYANVKVDTAPNGLIFEFKDYLRFGVMVFNGDGSGSECDQSGAMITCAKHCSTTSTKACYIDSDCPSGESCVLNTKLDGGKIVSYIGYDPVGDHSSGLIKAIDDVQATSWTPWAESFYNAIGYFANRTDLRLQTADFDAAKNPSDVRCRMNNILIISDGGSTADQNASVSALAATYGSTSGTCGGYAGSKNLDDLAWLAQNRNIRTFVTGSVSTDNPTEMRESITTYVVYSGPPSTSTDQCQPQVLMNSTAVNGGTGSAYIANTYDALTQSLRDAFKKAASVSASGTAASILNNSEGSGANLLQAVFYPKKVFSYTPTGSTTPIETSVNWIGELQNLWYYVDPYFSRSTIREDTDQNYTLNLVSDYSAKFRFDTSNNKNQTVVDLAQDTTGTGSSYVSMGTVDPDNVKSLWKAGKLLWTRDLSTSPRKIYTLTSSNAFSLMVPFSSAAADNFTNSSTVWSLMQTASSSSSAAQQTAATAQVVDYIHGYDASGLRSRTVNIGGVSKTWKLGDIVDSTPKLLSSLPINSYALQSPNGYGDSSYSLFSGSNNYKHRGMVFVGANDGMLHAFRLGVLDVSGQTTTTKAKMRDSSGNIATSSSGLGEEVWSFIPRNVLPYLKYFGDPDYAHQFYVDNTVSLFDASINKAGCTDANYWTCAKKTQYATTGTALDMDNTSWRSILIGGMGLGGASRDRYDATGTEITCASCVKTPVNGIGYSSYFALDVTNPENLPNSNPSSDAVKFMWEFNGGGELGYSTTGPAIVRVGDKGKNGRWLAVFGSGPTGPINTVTHAFKGQSDQRMKIFVVDVATGSLVRKIDHFGTAASQGSLLPDKAFVGSLSNAVIDTDKWNSSSSGFYSDDAVYLGYVSDDGSGTWNKGGVIRILTKESLNPDDWEVSTVIDGIGPVTTSVTKLQDRNAAYDSSKANAAKGKLWLYFGTGRFYNKDDTPTDAFRLYGIQEPCYSSNSGSPLFTSTGPTNDFSNTASCTATVSEGDLQDQTGTSAAAPASTLALDKKGWYLNLTTSAANDGYNSERLITNPVASPSGAVFFTTFRPSTDVCSFLGNSYIWALNYASGAAPPDAAMKGKALVQVSTGEIAEVTLSTRFSSNDKRFDKRRIDSPITGMPPTAQGLALMTSPRPSKKILHYQER